MSSLSLLPDSEAVVSMPPREEYSIRAFYVDNERLHYAAPVDWSDAKAVKHLLGIDEP